MEDVSNEAWLIAHDVGKRRGFAIDFLSHEDQELVLAWLYRRLVDFSEKTVKYAARLDRDWDSEDSDSSITSLARLLTAPSHFDPFQQLLAKEKRAELPEVIKISYSQAAAYTILLYRFDWDLESLAEYLRLMLSILRKRMVASGILMKRQPSLFDRIESIDADFQPTRGHGVLSVSLQDEAAPQQLVWDFSRTDSPVSDYLTSAENRR